MGQVVGGKSHTPQVPCAQRLDACKSQVFFLPLYLAPGSLNLTEDSSRASGTVNEAMGMCADSLSGHCPFSLEMVRAAATCAPLS